MFLSQEILKRRAIVAVGCYDVLSAMIAEKCGFELIQVSGYGASASYLGYPDRGYLQIGDTIEITRRIAQRVGIPVMTDIDTGGGSPLTAARWTELAILAGVAGLNIEDQQDPKRCGHMAG